MWEWYGGGGTNSLIEYITTSLIHSMVWYGTLSANSTFDDSQKASDRMALLIVNEFVLKPPLIHT
jgi:hypothetical protein